jgi:hypothetical protein
VSVDTVILLGGGAVLASALYYAISGKGKAAQAIASVVHPSSPTLATTMAAIDEQAKERAYQAVSDQLVAQRATKYQADLMESLAPKDPAAGQ